MGGLFVLAIVCFDTLVQDLAGSRECDDNSVVSNALNDIKDRQHFVPDFIQLSLHYDTSDRNFFFCNKFSTGDHIVQFTKKSSKI